MHYYSEKDIQDIVAGVLSRTSLAAGQAPQEKEIPVEISARHVHLSKADVEAPSEKATASPGNGT